MRSLKRKRRITPRSKRVVTTGARHRGKEDDMLPGISDTECRIAELRYRDLHANAERQRIAAHASAPESDRLGRVALVHGRINTLVCRMSRSLHGLCVLETASATAR